MELITVSIRGWRRYKTKTSLQTNGKLVSILGPNEAGKSSALAAIHFLRSNNSAQLSDISRDGTPDDIEIVGYFHLSSTDLAAANLAVPTRLILTKTAEGPPRFRIEPPAPTRNTDIRQALKTNLRQVLSNKKFRDMAEDSTLDFVNEIYEDENW